MAQKKTAHRAPWTKEDVRELRAHSKSSNAATGDREDDETNRAGASAEGGNSRHRPGTSPLTLSRLTGSAKVRARAA